MALPKATQANLIIWAILIVGCAAMTVVAYYYDESPWSYLIYVFFALTVAALAVVAFFVTRQKAT
ncbi:MAG: hypothetical protein ABR501_11705 [Pyrinomonadaceae bacterium]